MWGALSDPVSYPVPTSVSANGRYLQDQFGRPFLLLADQLLPALHNGALADIQTVLADRAARGYNGIWFCLMPDSYIGAVDGLTDNAGNTPFTGTPPSMNAPTAANAVAAYWNNVDAVVNSAAQCGITCLLCPVQTGYTTWPGTPAGSIHQAQNWGNSNCNSYGQFLGARYKGCPNILWYHANDFGNNNSWISAPPSTTDNALMEQIVSGIKTAGDTHLHTVELDFLLSLASDDSSSGGWRSLIDINQTYTYFQTYDITLKGWLGINSNDALNQAQRYTPKPVFLGESNYEGADDAGAGAHPASAFTLRCQNYWTTLAGGLAGQVWGNKTLHHFSAGWQTSLNTEGAIEASIWAQFFRSIAFHTLVPDSVNTFVTSGFGTYDGGTTSASYLTTTTNAGTSSYAMAAVDPAGSLGVVYTPVNQGLVVAMTKMRGTVTARWFDPTTGTYTSIGSFANTGTHTFTPSGTHTDGKADWVLVLTA
jgi:hypothetical protein